ncbi:cysteine hydrolase family protein [Pokkaliibacter sp. MBI-7]|uniref:cysteine hydrolase family protein n=1 Tax=Pokkaliibacter sp. MBI-7 TaxID=3040600 RepID=UPI00244CAC78|nr:cysteine hydrolase family protein [Pokkaliibacter sp. MBI-7]MDH2433943.1 cysteine hydrolase family protein [Pokkaliibacter sp. MBI-7]
MPNQISKDSSKSALLIIDMQVGLFDAPQPPYQREQLLSNINQLIAAARLAQAPILVAMHTGPQHSAIAAGSPLWQPVPGLDLDLQQDQLFNKTRPSCFEGTALAQQLAEQAIDRLIICGMKTQFCVDTTCRSACERGLAVVLAADAHSCPDGELLSAAQIIQHHNQTLAGAFADVQPAARIRFGTPSQPLQCGERA